MAGVNGLPHRHCCLCDSWRRWRYCELSHNIKPLISQQPPNFCHHIRTFLGHVTHPLKVLPHFFASHHPKYFGMLPPKMLDHPTPEVFCHSTLQHILPCHPSTFFAMPPKKITLPPIFLATQHRNPLPLPKLFCCHNHKIYLAIPPSKYHIPNFVATKPQKVVSLFHEQDHLVLSISIW